MLSSLTQTRLFLTIVVSCFLVLIWQHRDVLTKPISLRPSASISEKNNTVLNAESDAPDSEEHFMRPDGLLEVNMDGRHPVLVLMEDAKKRWRSMNDRQSKTLYEAVTEYKRRHGYPPPAGFDLWWEYVKKHNVKLVDEFDQINYDITPYLALSPKVLRQRLKELEDGVGFHFNISEGNFDVYGDGWWLGNPRQLTSIVMEFCRSLPDMVIHGHHSFRGDIWLGEDLRKDAHDKVKTLESFTDAELAYYENIDRNDRLNLTNVCLPHDPVFALSHPSKASFIKSHLDYLKVCSSSGLQQSTNLLFSPSAHDIKLSPFFVFSKCQPGAGFLLPTSTWDYHDMTLIEPHPWQERRDPDARKLFWRGTTTGWSWHQGLSRIDPNVSWRNGSRAKLAILFGESDVTPQDDIELLLQDPDDGNKLFTKKYPRSMLNRLWMDIGLIGDPVQCNQGDGTCAEMNKTTIWKSPAFLPTIGQKKFFVDLDANDWSTDFQRRLAFGQVVFKSSAFVEWNTRWLIPYFHYIPIQSDYSDVYNIMAFFLGDPKSGSGAHEGLAEEIGNNAIQFSQEYWRWEDMVAYLYRLLLEYARLLNEDKIEASYELLNDEYYA